MKIRARISWFMTLLLAICCVAGASALAQSDKPALVQGKQPAQSKANILFTTHDEIVAGAKKEGKLRLLGSLTPSTYKSMIVSFKKRYPFIDVTVEEITGTDAPQRFLLELKAGRVTDWDIFDMAPDFYSEYLPHVKRFDILGMAIHNVLAIPPAMVDPKNRNVVSVASSIHAIAYNKKMISEEKVPKSWEDFLKPEYKGKKFMVDIRPQGFAALAGGLGERWAIDYATKIAAQQPIWVRGQSRSLASMVAGENALLHLAYYDSCMRAAKKDVTGSLECKVVEPVPARLLEFAAINAAAPRPFSALLWLEFQVSPEGQSIIDEHGPLNSSIYAADSALARLTKGKKMSVNNWDTLENTSRWQEMVFKEFGFPKGDEKTK